MTTHTVRIGTVPGYSSSGREVQADVFCKIQYEGGELAITGVEGPTANGDAYGACGQIEMTYRTPEERATITPAPGWDAAMIDRLFDIWGRWHLNKMRPGSPRQSAWLRDNPIPESETRYPASHYVVASHYLADAGLNPDAEYHPDVPNVGTSKGYRYGSAWLREEVPADVIAWLFALPAADKEPAWI